MPCDSITTQTVALAKAQPAILAEALRAAGWHFDINTSTEIKAYSESGAITWRAGQGLEIRASYVGGPDRLVTTVIQAYSKAAVSWAAQRAGWQVAKTESNKLTLTKR